MIGQLYADGVMQQTEDFNFTVLQGSCVGGSTTVNNAVCFRPPQPVLERWNDLNEERRRARPRRSSMSSVAQIEHFLPVTPQPNEPLNPSWPRYVEGAANAGLSPAKLEVDPVNANIHELPRLRLLQHRLRVRPQAVHARHGAARRASSSRTGGCGSWPTARWSGSAP